MQSGKVFGVLQGGVFDVQGQLLPGIAKAEPVYPVLLDNLVGEVQGEAMQKLADETTQAATTPASTEPPPPS